MNLIERIKLRFKLRRDNKQFIYGQEIQEAKDEIIIKRKDKIIDKLEEKVSNLLEVFPEFEDTLREMKETNTMKFLSKRREYQIREKQLDTILYKIKQIKKGAR